MLKFYDFIVIGILCLIPLGIWAAMTADDMVYNFFYVAVGLVFISSLIAFCERLDSGKEILLRKKPVS